MNAYLKKEIRLLLPTFIAALVLAFLIGLIPCETYFVSGMRNAMNTFGKTGLGVILPFFLSPALVLMMTLNSFGHEFSTGTFANLLTQPISRVKIWRTKTILLAIAILIIWAAWWLFSINKIIVMNLEDLWDTSVGTIIFPLVVYSGGLWTVLLLRQMAAAFWFTLLVPAGLALLTSEIARKLSISVEALVVSVLGIYAVAGFIFARWLFLRAQDVHWTGGEISLPAIFSSSKLKTVQSSSGTFDHAWLC